MAGLVYAAGFEVGGANAMRIYAEGDDAQIVAGYYMPGSLTTTGVTDAEGNVWPSGAYTSFATAVQTALNTLPTAPGYTCTWSPATGLYTVAYTGAFILSFDLGTGDNDYNRMADALGFARDTNYSGATSYTSVKIPRYVMESEIDGRTNVEGPYESDDIADESVSDGGDDFGQVVKTSELFMDWEQQQELHSSSAHLAAKADGRVSSWQRFFRDARNIHPFWCSDVRDGEPSGVFYRLTARGAAWIPKRVTSDLDTLWIIPFQTRWLGVYTP